ncbi:helix-turn-helix transcriptional regulator [Deinococcus sp.]|uniref:helix-turn-helix transcriptional regulator n=1 Tax=Deinococcus sp. TaxID=47478 RepID=UPI003B59983B
MTADFAPEAAQTESLPKTERLFRLASLLRAAPRSVGDLVRLLYPTISAATIGVGGSSWPKPHDEPDERPPVQHDTQRQWQRLLWRLERSIQRDIEDLERLEDDFERISGRPPRYRIRTHRSQLHPVEMLALHAAARLTYHRASGQRLHHRAALEKLGQWLPEHLHGVVARSVQDVGRRSSREDLNLEKVAAAWLGGHPLRFEYRKPGGSGQWRTNIMEIYLIEAHPQNLDLYLIGQETSFHREVRTFKLSRLRSLHVLTDQMYRIPDSFDPQQFFHSAWGVVGTQGQVAETITLRFRADAAYRILEGGYAQMSEPIPHPDGSLTARIDAPIDSSGLPREVLPWILSFGPRVQVLSPPHIRQHWLDELRAAVAGADDGAGGEETV